MKWFSEGVILTLSHLSFLQMKIKNPALSFEDMGCLVSFWVVEEGYLCHELDPRESLSEELLFPAAVELSAN